jgi:hypothetical protein
LIFNFLIKFKSIDLLKIFKIDAMARFNNSISPIALILSFLALSNSSFGQSVSGFFVEDSSPNAQSEINSVATLDEGYLYAGKANRFNLQNVNIQSVNGQMIIGKNNDEHETVWIKTFVSSGNSHIRRVKKISDGILITGIGRGTVNFGTEIRSFNQQGAPFVAKLNNEGTVQWVFNASLPGEGWGIDTDSDNNIYWAGAIDNSFSMSFTNGSGESVSFDSNSSSGRVGFVLKLNEDGDFVWHKIIGSNGNNRLKDLVVDESNNVFVAGFYNSSVSLGNGVNIPSDSSLNGLIFGLTCGGYPIWHKVFSNSGVAACYGIDVNHENVSVIGEFQNSLSIQGTNAMPVSSAGQKDIFLASFEKEQGGLNYLRNIKSTGDDLGRSVQIDSSNIVSFVGWVNGSAYFDNANNSLNHLGSKDAIFGQLDAEGELIFMGTLGNLATERFQSLSISDDHKIYGAGYVSGSSNLSFNEDDLPELSNNSNRRGFVVAVDPCTFESENIELIFNDSWENPELFFSLSNSNFISNTGFLAYENCALTDELEVLDENLFNWPMLETVYLKKNNPMCSVSDCFKLDVDSTLLNSINIQANFSNNIGILAIENVEVLNHLTKPAVIQWTHNNVLMQELTNEIEIENPESGIWFFDITAGDFVVSDTIVILPTSISTLSQATNLKVYPNPFTSEFIIECEASWMHYKIVVRDAVGKEVQFLEINSEKQIINLGTVKSGVYFLTVFDLNGKMASTTKLIKTN